MKAFRISRGKQMLLAIALLLLLVIIVGARAVSSPSHGHTTTSLTSMPTAPRKPVGAPITPTSVANTPYYQLALPPGYKQQSSSSTVPGLLYQQSLIKSSASGSLIIAIGISELGGGLADSSAYRLRAENPSRYMLSTKTAGGSSVIIANDTQASAVVAFWVHGTRLATVSVTSGLQNPVANDNADQLKALEPLLAAWQWQ